MNVLYWCPYECLRTRNEQWSSAGNAQRWPAASRPGLGFVPAKVVGVTDSRLMWTNPVLVKT